MSRKNNSLNNQLNKWICLPKQVISLIYSRLTNELIADMDTSTMNIMNTSTQWEQAVNVTSPNGSVTGCPASVHDIVLDKTYRLLILYATVILCIFGSMLVLLWMILNKRVSPNYQINHHSHVNIFILNLIIADVLVILLAVVPQIVWEYSDRQWAVGDFMCRVLKFLQTFSMTASNYMLVVIAIDRHQAVRAPLKKSFSVSTSVKQKF